MERIVKFSCKPGDTVIDMFGGTFSTARVCRALDVNCISIEISEETAQHGIDEGLFDRY
jgi:DNA modification methylase